MSFSSDEVNFLVYRYLQESGEVHRTKGRYDSVTVPFILTILLIIKKVSL